MPDQDDRPAGYDRFDDRVQVTPELSDRASGLRRPCGAPMRAEVVEDHSHVVTERLGQSKSLKVK